VLAISRSATTTEVLDALGTMPRIGHRTGVTGVDATVSSSFDDLVDTTIRLTDADEESVVQTRFPTTLIALARAGLGDTTDLAAHGHRALEMDLPSIAALEHLVFLGSGWTVGLANEAALKVREMAQAWSESHVAMDYRHGPIAVAGERSLVFNFGDLPTGLLNDLRSTGAQVWCEPDLDPLAQLVIAQRLGMAMALAKGLDPDRPNRLTRSVVLATVDHHS
jgi:glutamine---fructose-6-phosphate transaminase (isomerizing)